MRSKIEMAPRLPLELIRHVADSCNISSVKLSLALLNKACYRDIISVLYRRIHISSSKRLFSFAHAFFSAKPSLYLFLRSLKLRIRKIKGTYFPSQVIYEKIRDVLLVVDNLTELALDVDPEIGLSLLSDHSLELVAFRLKRFSCPYCNEPDVRKFLSYQNNIEQLDCSDPRGYGLSHPELASVEPITLLPELRCLIAGVQNVFRWVPRRPVSKVLVTEPITSEAIQPIVSAISQATVPLLYLNIHTLWVPSSSGDSPDIMMWLLGLSDFHKSLEALTFRIAPHQEILDFVKVDLDRLKSALSHFVALQTLTIEITDSFRIRPLKLKVSELERFGLWKEACPSLRYVSLFGSRLSCI
ncbi:hypothetical protein FRC12_012460 [Ceratobasidium sp. 428]|nr:hypothetical protein FRC12_012460 [Ceratobasidium sp. 428]